MSYILVFIGVLSVNYVMGIEFSCNFQRLFDLWLHLLLNTEQVLYFAVFAGWYGVCALPILRRYIFQIHCDDILVNLPDSLKYINFGT